MGQFAFYLSNGAVDVTAAIAVVLVLVQVTKGWVIDSWLPTSKPIHDYVVQSYDVLLSLGIVTLLMWAGPGFHTRTEWAVTLLSTIVSAAASFGVYGAIRGPVPRTPTAAYLDAVARLTPVVPAAARHAVHNRPVASKSIHGRDTPPTTVPLVPKDDSTT